MTENTNPQTQPSQPKPQLIQRRTIFIKKGLQLRFVALVVLSVALGIAIMIYEIVSAMLTLFQNHPALLHPFYEKIVPLSLNVGLKVAIYITLVAIVAAILSHKTAGPIYKIEKTCKEIADSGDLSKRVYLRKGDLFMDLKDEFNKMMDSIETKTKK